MIDCTLMTGARSLIRHRHAALVPTKLLIFTFCLNICKVTANVAITFEWDSLVSSFGWLLQRYRWDSPNQINTLFFSRDLSD